MNQIVVVNEPNRWRLESPGATGWPRSARPDAAKKYFMVSADGHANEPANLWVERIEAKYKERLPRVTTDKDGVQWRTSAKATGSTGSPALDARRRGPGA